MGTDFFEEDEPAGKVEEIFDKGEKGATDPLEDHDHLRPEDVRELKLDHANLDGYCNSCQLIWPCPTHKLVEAYMEYDNAVSWGTDCIVCARNLDQSYAEWVEKDKMRIERDLLADMLKLVLIDMHQTYANTSRRGSGIGGQALTTQCSVIDPIGTEVQDLEKAEHVLREHRLAREAEGRPMQERNQ